MKFKRLNEGDSFSDSFWDFYDKYGEKGIYKECDKFIKKNQQIVFFDEFGNDEPDESFYEKFFRTCYIKDVQKILENLLEYPDMNYDKIGELIKEIYEFGLYLDVSVEM